MNYTLEIVALVTIVLLLIYTQQILHFFNLTNLKFKITNPKIVKPNKIEQKILIKLANLEKFLYKKRFTRRIILKDYTSIKEENSVCYIFYYYQLIDGIHAYIDVTVKNLDSIDFSVHFETQYDSKKVAISTNNTNYLLHTMPENIYLFKHNNLSIEELYKAHFKDREINKETLYKKRLSEQDLIKQAIKQEEEQINKLTLNGYIKHTNYGFKLLPTYKLFKNTQDSYNILKITKTNSKSIIKLIGLYIGLTTIFSIAFFFNLGQVDTNKTSKIYNTKSELAHFKKQIQSYKGLTITLSGKKPYTLKESMQELDNYFKNSKIKRFIGKPLKTPIKQSNLPCKIPNDLEAIYKWHNGIELLVPNRDMFRYEDLQKSYNTFKKELKENNSSNLVFVFASKYKYRGLAYNCSKSGIYEYAINSKAPTRKEFYNINHFFKITAEAYKQKAFYDDFDTIKIDLKKFFKIYREYLSNGDIHRYKSLIHYLHQKAIDYKNAPKELKLALLNAISNTYDSDLIKSVCLYLNDNDQEIVSKAIYALGNVGNKSSLPTLRKFLKSKNQKYRDFALLAIAKIVDKKDKGLLEYIYPMLNDKSILIRLSAYEVIEKIASKDSLPILRKYFKKEKASIKIAIAKIFGKIGGNQEFTLLKNYLKDINKMDFSAKIKDTARGDNPHPKIIQYEIVKAIAQIMTNMPKN